MPLPYTGVTWPSIHFPMRTGALEASANVYSLATDITVSNNIICLLPRNLTYSARTRETVAG